MTTSSRPTGPPDPFRGHEFEYDSRSDLFQCVYCEDYEVTARADARADNDPAGITQCPGLPAWQADGTERVFLAVTLVPKCRAEAGGWGIGTLARTIGNNRLGRSCRFGYRDGVMLVETSPSVADRLADDIGRIEHPDSTTGPMAATVERLDPAAAAERLADNYADYVATYGEPRP